MSRNVWARVLAAVVVVIAAGHPGAQESAGCGPGGEAALARAASAVAVSDGDAAAAILREAYGAAPTCAPLGTASWAWHGWLGAARAHAAGGTEESLSDVRAALAVLEPADSARSADAAYAAAILHAAAAAAQQEREEMRVWLEHAADLARRLAPGMHDPAMADAAFQRALAEAPTPAALRGLGRARAGGDNMKGGCEPYRKALALAEAESPDGPLAVEARAFLRLCR
jgi:hypothetical protein